MRTDLWESLKDILIVLFSFVKVLTAEFEFSSVFVWTGTFSKTLLAWTRIFIYTDEKRFVFKNIRIRVDEALELLQ